MANALDIIIRLILRQGFFSLLIFAITIGFVDQLEAKTVTNWLRSIPHQLGFYSCNQLLKSFLYSPSELTINPKQMKLLFPKLRISRLRDALDLSLTPSTGEPFPLLDIARQLRSPEVLRYKNSDNLRLSLLATYLWRRGVSYKIHRTNLSWIVVIEPSQQSLLNKAALRIHNEYPRVAFGFNMSHYRWNSWQGFDHRDPLWKEFDGILGISTNHLIYDDPLDWITIDHELGHMLMDQYDHIEHFISGDFKSTGNKNDHYIDTGSFDEIFQTLRTFKLTFEQNRMASIQDKTAALEEISVTFVEIVMNLRSQFAGFASLNLKQLVEQLEKNEICFEIRADRNHYVAILKFTRTDQDQTKNFVLRLPFKKVDSPLSITFERLKQRLLKTAQWISDAEIDFYESLSPAKSNEQRHRALYDYAVRQIHLILGVEALTPKPLYQDPFP